MQSILWLAMGSTDLWLPTGIMGKDQSLLMFVGAGVRIDNLNIFVRAIITVDLLLVEGVSL